MVKLHSPSNPTRIVVKRARRSCELSRGTTCIWPGCSAHLAHDHDLPVCGHHVRSAYNPRHDRRLHELVRHLLLAAYPCAVDLCAVMRCESDDVKGAVRYLNRREADIGGRIVGARRGYVFEPAAIVPRPRRGTRRVKA